MKTYPIIGLLLCSFSINVAAAPKKTGHTIPAINLSQTTYATPKALAQKNYATFTNFLENSLSGQGKIDFYQMSQQVKRNIQWLDDNNTNAYNNAFHRSFKFLQTYDLTGMPAIIMLIPYMESQWYPTKGDPKADYGYWQLVPEVLNEIKQLDYVPASFHKYNLDQIRENPQLSTKAAQIHLRRYYFYFAKVAKYSESEAWLFTLVAYNWGAGNVKRVLAELKAKGQTPDFANFYHTLYNLYRKHPNDRSIRAAAAYVPSLWNLAQLLKKLN
jgi:hypothetical protein